MPADKKTAVEKIPIAEAAQRCGIPLAKLNLLLALPDNHPRKPKNLKLVDPGYLEAKGVFKYIQRSESRQGQANILDDEDLALVLHKVGQMRYGVRNQALIAITNYGGLRAVEIARLLMGDIVDAENRLKEKCILKRSRTKTKRNRVLIFTNATLRKYMIAHINERIEAGAKPSDPAFLAPRSGTHYTRHNMARAITYLYQAAGHAECSSHSGRARVATKVIKSSDLKAAQLMLGHTSPATTMAYGRYTDAELGAIQEDL